MKTLDVRQRAAEKARGVAFYQKLSPSEQGELGDALVLGYFDWRDWFHEKPSRSFMAGIDYAMTTLSV